MPQRQKASFSTVSSTVTIAARLASRSKAAAKGRQARSSTAAPPTQLSHDQRSSSHVRAPGVKHNSRKDTADRREPYSSQLRDGEEVTFWPAAEVPGRVESGADPTAYREEILDEQVKENVWRRIHGIRMAGHSSDNSLAHHRGDKMHAMELHGKHVKKKPANESRRRSEEEEEEAEDEKARAEWRERRREERRRKREEQANQNKQESTQTMDDAAFKENVYSVVKASLSLVMTKDVLSLTVDNLTPLMKGLQLSTGGEEVQELIMEALLETYGFIEPHKVDNLVMEKKMEEEMAELEECVDTAFDIIDQDGDGLITHSDVYRLMIKLGEVLWDREVDAMVAAADVDGDGRISKKDLFRFLLGQDKRVKQPEVNHVENGDQEQQEPEETREAVTGIAPSNKGMAPQAAITTIANVNDFDNRGKVHRPATVQNISKHAAMLTATDQGGNVTDSVTDDVLEVDLPNTKREVNSGAATRVVNTLTADPGKAVLAGAPAAVIPTAQSALQECSDWSQSRHVTSARGHDITDLNEDKDDHEQQAESPRGDTGSCALSPLECSMATPPSTPMSRSLGVLEAESLTVESEHETSSVSADRTITRPSSVYDTDPDEHDPQAVMSDKEGLLSTDNAVQAPPKGTSLNGADRKLTSPATTPNLSDDDHQQDENTLLRKLIIKIDGSHPEHCEDPQFSDYAAGGQKIQDKVCAAKDPEDVPTAPLSQSNSPPAGTLHHLPSDRCVTSYNRRKSRPAKPPLRRSLTCCTVMVKDLTVDTAPAGCQASAAAFSRTLRPSSSAASPYNAFRADRNVSSPFFRKDALLSLSARSSQQQPSLPSPSDCPRIATSRCMCRQQTVVAPSCEALDSSELRPMSCTSLSNADLEESSLAGDTPIHNLHIGIRQMPRCKQETSINSFSRLSVDVKPFVVYSRGSLSETKARQVPYWESSPESESYQTNIVQHKSGIENHLIENLIHDSTASADELKDVSFSLDLRGKHQGKASSYSKEERHLENQGILDQMTDPQRMDNNSAQSVQDDRLLARNQHHVSDDSVRQKPDRPVRLICAKTASSLLTPRLIHSYDSARAIREVCQASGRLLETKAPVTTNDIKPKSVKIVTVDDDIVTTLNLRSGDDISADTSEKVNDLELSVNCRIPADARRAKDSNALAKTDDRRFIRPHSAIDSKATPVCVHVVDLTSLLKGISDTEVATSWAGERQERLGVESNKQCHSKGHFGIRPLARVLVAYERARRNQAMLAVSKLTQETNSSSNPIAASLTSISRQLEHGIVSRPAPIAPSPERSYRKDLTPRKILQSPLTGGRSGLRSYSSRDIFHRHHHLRHHQQPEQQSFVLS